MRLLWATILALCILGALVRAASCEPVTAKWADPSERAVAYRWEWAPPMETDPFVLAAPEWQEIPGPQTPQPWPHCWTGPVETPGDGHLRVRAVDAAGRVSGASNPRAVPEPPGALAVGLAALALLGRSRGISQATARPT